MHERMMEALMEVVLKVLVLCKPRVVRRNPIFEHHQNPNQTMFFK